MTERNWKDERETWNSRDGITDMEKKKTVGGHEKTE